MPYKRSSRIARHFPSPKIWPFGAKTEFFNTHAYLRQLSAGQQLSSEQEASQRPNQCADTDYEKVCSHQYDSRPSPHPLRTDSWSQVEEGRREKERDQCCSC